MKTILTILTFITAISAFGQTAITTRSTVSNVRLSFANADLRSPGRGAENWLNDNNFDNINSLKLPLPTDTLALDFYARINWGVLEKATSDSTGNAANYDWTWFDSYIQSAITNGQKFNFGILPMTDSYSPYARAGGANLSYPPWLHTAMQGEAVKDWKYVSGDSSWIPNWNSRFWYKGLKNLYTALVNYINTTSYLGVPYANAIGYIDIRGYGNFGEWHLSPWSTVVPAADSVTVATLDSIISLHLQRFPNNPLVVLMNAYDPANASNTQPSVSYYALTAKNTYGQVGWRRDNWGAGYYDSILSANPTTYGGLVFKTAIINMYKTAPVVGEPNAVATDSPPYIDLPREIRLYHATSFGNGNWSSLAAQGTKDSILLSSKLSGHRLQIDSVKIEQVIQPNTPFTIATYWANTGLAPAYYKWNVVYKLYDYKTDTLMASYSSYFKPYLFLPTTTDSLVTETFTAPNAAAINNNGYRLKVVVQDPVAYMKPMQLYHSNPARNTDGSYTLVVNDGKWVKLTRQ
jgi:hypothetical protein